MVWKLRIVVFSEAQWGKGWFMQGTANRRLLNKQILFTGTLLLLGAVYSGAVYVALFG